MVGSAGRRKLPDRRCESWLGRELHESRLGSLTQAACPVDPAADVDVMRKTIGLLVATVVILSCLVTPSSTSTAAAVANGGTVSDDELVNYDWVAALATVGGGHHCTAAFISRTQLITAAHCVLGAPAFEVYVGIDSTGQPRQRYAVAATTAHPGYHVQRDASQDYIAIHDIAIVEIAGSHDTWAELDFDESVVAEGTPTVAYGYGLPNPGRLTMLAEPITVGIGCQAGHNPHTHLFCLDNGLVERDGALVNDTVCAGDSGGPVVVGRSIVGVHSLRMPLNDGCPGTTTRSGHTAVALSRGFIEAHLDPSTPGEPGVLAFVDGETDPAGVTDPTHKAAEQAGPAQDEAANEVSPERTEETEVSAEAARPAIVVSEVATDAEGPQIAIMGVGVTEEGGTDACHRVVIVEYLADIGLDPDQIQDVSIHSAGSGKVHSVIASHHGEGIWKGTITRGLPDCESGWNVQAVVEVVAVDATEYIATASVGELSCDSALSAVDPGMATDLVDPVTSSVREDRACPRPASSDVAGQTPD